MPFSVNVRAFDLQELTQILHPIQVVSFHAKLGLRFCDSGLLHHLQRKGQPFRKTTVRIPGPS